MRLGIGTFLPPEDFVGEIVLHGFPQQSLLIRAVVLKFPRHAVEIFRDTPVAERYANFQAAKHGHPVFAVGKGHKGKTQNHILSPQNYVFSFLKKSKSSSYTNLQINIDKKREV